MKLATSDGRFDVVVLCPMKSKGKDKDKSDLGSCLKIKAVIERLLASPTCRR
ncbi:hypothetical protein QTI24_24500 [Variovorax sp. J22P240]|uniref:hypothetical protein n=1 Tax=Variovorax sp. J22P240 TaxID=3053514 RepID=UPI00257825D3|nr:hypothetical protein [Variovorax sp. J22P240]MDM0001791.1 hypothetical protein [Variovorax sp. J22P240]